jgi:DNA adenine methylase
MLKTDSGAFVRYLGGKCRMVEAIAERLHATGKTCLVDVFGGSGAVTMYSGFRKRVYNDINGDLVNLFRVMADDKLRPGLLKKLRWTPPSRQIYTEDHQIYVSGGLSFKEIDDPVDRARATFYKLRYCFGGKYRNGGFAMSVSGRKQIKEIQSYQKVLRDFAAVGAFFRETVIENLDFSELIKRYGDKEGVVLFADPPYPGYTYYANELNDNDHRLLAEMLELAPAPVICTFYDVPLIREIYGGDRWLYEPVTVVKNSQATKGARKAKVEEFIISKRGNVKVAPARKKRQLALIEGASVGD